LRDNSPHRLVFLVIVLVDFELLQSFLFSWGLAYESGRSGYDLAGIAWSGFYSSKGYMVFREQGDNMGLFIGESRHSPAWSKGLRWVGAIEILSYLHSFGSSVGGCWKEQYQPTNMNGRDDKEKVEMVDSESSNPTRRGYHEHVGTLRRLTPSPNLPRMKWRPGG
jgi:hypothetical protein